MKGKNAQVELAIIKGLALALGIVGAFLVYEVITAQTPDGDSIKCEWDCSKAQWSVCAGGYSYRDVNFCVSNDNRCLNSEPKPPTKTKCD
ncbi:hypothetical protein HY638_01190 [Candidatus Woesearchaeota archaeon]|nr:hypothetical protein [Candidatus Woesearchaeota archaeon]